MCWSLSSGTAYFVFMYLFVFSAQIKIFKATEAVAGSSTRQLRKRYWLITSGYVTNLKMELV